MHLFHGRHRGLLATFAATVLGIAITLYTIPQIQTKVLTSDADAWYSSTRDYFRLWHPPWAPQHHVRASHVFDESKTPCQRTLLYRFAGAHGFASEYLIFLRVAMLAEHFGYHLLLDDSRWNYGRWADYFEPLRLPCSDPLIGDDRRAPLAPVTGDPPLAFISLNGSAPAWAASPHVIWSQRRLDYLDQCILDLYTRPGSVDELHRLEVESDPSAPPLNSSATLPSAYESVFESMSKRAYQLWALNSEMQIIVDNALISLKHLGIPDVPVIAAHIRLGDKSLEFDKFSPNVWSGPRKSLLDLYKLWSSRLGNHEKQDKGRKKRARTPDSPAKSADASVYVEAAVRIKAKIESSRSPAVNRNAKPILLLISDDISGQGLRAFKQHRSMSTFQLQIGLDTFPPLVQKQANGAPVPNGEHEDVVDDRPSKKTQYGFDEGLFNALPTHERKKMATTFLRDLTVVSRSADGLVYTGTSNVGRLLALLNAQASLKKPVQTSVDVHWFPTARYQ